MKYEVVTHMHTRVYAHSYMHTHTHTNNKFLKMRIIQENMKTLVFHIFVGDGVFPLCAHMPVQVHLAAWHFDSKLQTFL